MKKTLSKKDNDKIRSIARSTRNTFIRMVELIEDVDVREDPHLISMFTTASHLGGLCMIASAVVTVRLQKHRFNASCISTFNHYFTSVRHFKHSKQHDLLVDVTASQFGQNEIVIRDWGKLQEQHDDCKRINDYWCLNPKQIAEEEQSQNIEYFKSLAKIMEKDLRVPFLRELTL